jgi:hypothetical protein
MAVVSALLRVRDTHREARRFDAELQTALCRSRAAVELVPSH